MGARIAPRPIAAWLALAVLLAGVAATVVVAAAGPSILVAGSQRWTSFPDWLAGPLHGLFGRVMPRPSSLGRDFSAVIVAVTLAYFVALGTARSLPTRGIAAFIVIAEAILFLGPALQLTDAFNYLGYARLWALHGLNPYTHVIRDELHDPVYGFASWYNWRSPYGSLFTVLTYPLGLMSLPAAYWTLKAVTVLASLGLLWLVWKCARLLGHDPRLPLLIVGANPIYLIYAVGGFHNDFYMLVPSMAAVCLLLCGRYRAAGVALAIGIAVKVTVVLLLPFLLLAAWRRQAAMRLLSGVLIGALPLAMLSFALFGPALPNVAGQSRLLTGLSVPNLVGWALGLGGGTPSLVRDMNVVIAVVVTYQLLRGRDWLSGAGWATLAMLATLGWLMPWYVVWLLPLAAIAANVNLRLIALACTVFLVLTFLPLSGSALSTLDINPSAGPVGLAAWNYQWVSQFGRPGVIYGRDPDVCRDSDRRPTPVRLTAKGGTLALNIELGRASARTTTTDRRLPPCGSLSSTRRRLNRRAMSV
jgi:hypothetical protein